MEAMMEEESVLSELALVSLALVSMSLPEEDPKAARWAMSC